uniref:Uncharacterized protein n=1 Tax=Arundo donax TaxID=35708 RepID=A0A0A9FBF5_ARUDO
MCVPQWPLLSFINFYNIYGPECKSA